MSVPFELYMTREGPVVVTIHQAVFLVPSLMRYANLGDLFVAPD